MGQISQRTNQSREKAMKKPNKRGPNQFETKKSGNEATSEKQTS